MATTSQGRRVQRTGARGTGRARRALAAAASLTAILALAPAAARGAAIYREGTGPQRLVQDYEEAAPSGEARGAEGVGVRRDEGALVVELDAGVERHRLRSHRDLPDGDGAAARSAAPEFRIEAVVEVEEAPESYGLYWGGSRAEAKLDSLMDELAGRRSGALRDYASFTIHGSEFRAGSVRSGEYEPAAEGPLAGAAPAKGGQTHTLEVRQRGGRIELALDGETLHTADAAAFHGDGPGTAHGIAISGAGSLRVESYSLETRGEPASRRAGERALREGLREGDAAALERALSHLRPLAREGEDAHAQWRLAQMYAGGAGVEQDASRARDWALRAAGADHLPSQLLLAEILSRGPAALRNGPSALEWLKRAAGTPAEVWRGQAWYDDEEDVHTGWMRSALERGARDRWIRREIRYRMGLIHGDGLGVEQDHEKARGWFERATADGPHAGADFALGLVYLNGRGVDADPVRAVELLERAATAGEPRAPLALGLAHAAEGSPVRDLEASYRWLAVAAELLPEGAERRRAERAKASLAKVLSAEQRERAGTRAAEWLGSHR